MLIVRMIGNSYQLHDYSTGMDLRPSLTQQMVGKQIPNYPFALSLAYRKDPSELYHKIM